MEKGNDSEVGNPQQVEAHQRYSQEHPSPVVVAMGRMPSALQVEGS